MGLSNLASSRISILILQLGLIQQSMLITVVRHISFCYKCRIITIVVEVVPLALTVMVLWRSIVFLFEDYLGSKVKLVLAYYHRVAVCLQHHSMIEFIN